MMRTYKVNYELKRHSKTPGFIVKMGNEPWSMIIPETHSFEAACDESAREILLAWKEQKETVPIGESFSVAKREVIIVDFYMYTQVTLP